MRLFCLLVFIIALSSCSKTSEFSVQTSSILILPPVVPDTSKTLVKKDTTFIIKTDTIQVDSFIRETLVPRPIEVSDTVPTNFAYNFQANLTDAAHVKQLLVENVKLTITNNSFGSSFNHFKTIRVAISTLETPDTAVALFLSSPSEAPANNKIPTSTIPLNSTTLQLTSGVNAAAFANADSYQLTISAVVDTIPYDMEIQANVAFYVKAKTD